MEIREAIREVEGKRREMGRERRVWFCIYSLPLLVFI